MSIVLCLQGDARRMTQARAREWECDTYQWRRCCCYCCCCCCCWVAVRQQLIHIQSREPNTTTSRQRLNETATPIPTAAIPILVAALRSSCEASSHAYRQFHGGGGGSDCWITTARGREQSSIAADIYNSSSSTSRVWHRSDRYRTMQLTIVPLADISPARPSRPHPGILIWPLAIAPIDHTVGIASTWPYLTNDLAHVHVPTCSCDVR